jgi:hypothetical protein
MCPCAPPRIRRTCCTASTAKSQVLETTQKPSLYAYFRGFDVTLGRRTAVDFLDEALTADGLHSQLDDSRTSAAFILRRFGDGFHVRMFL